MAGVGEKLRITKLETMLVQPRWLFLKTHADCGIMGLGEPIVEGRARTCAATKWGFRDILGKRAASILLTDLCHAGGISSRGNLHSPALLPGCFS